MSSTRLWFTLLAGLLPLVAFGQTPAQRSRIERLEGAVLAPCCYAEPVLRHQSDVSVKMRVEIANWVVAGKSDREILDAYVAQYGEKVLVDPRTIPHGWVPFIPWALLVAGVFVTAAILRKWRQRAPVLRPAADAPEAQIDDLDLL
jgi:cytochrome c-type biogenesis protein CcmH